MKMPEEVIETEKSIGRVWKFKLKVNCKKVYWWTIYKHYLLIILYKKTFFIYFLEFFPIFLTSRKHDDETKGKRSGKGCNYYNYIVFCRWQGGVERIQGEFFKNWWFYLEFVWLWRISGGNLRRWCSWFWRVISVLLLSHISICSFRLCHMW